MCRFVSLIFLLLALNSCIYSGFKGKSVPESLDYVAQKERKVVIKNPEGERVKYYRVTKQGGQYYSRTHKKDSTVIQLDESDISKVKLQNPFPAIIITPLLLPSVFGISYHLVKGPANKD